MALGMSSAAIIVILGLIPISELRGAIIYGLSATDSVFAVVFLAVTANLLVIPFVFFFLDFFHRYFVRIPAYKTLFDKFVVRTRRKAGHYTSKYGWLGLILFVAIPLPITGAYTGTLAAWLLGIERKRAALALGMGVVIAGIIVSTAYLIGLNLGTSIGSRLFG